jgi:hypothetical protein
VSALQLARLQFGDVTVPAYPRLTHRRAGLDAADEVLELREGRLG